MKKYINALDENMYLSSIRGDQSFDVTSEYESLCSILKNIRSDLKNKNLIEKQLVLRLYEIAVITRNELDYAKSLLLEDGIDKDRLSQNVDTFEKQWLELDKLITECLISD